jgi:hypothetical protein
MRRTPRALLIAAIVTTLSGTSAMAEVSVYYHTGSWDAFTGTAANGKLVCGIGSTNPTDNRSISMRFEIDGDTVQFHAKKPTWNIPPNTPISVVLQIGLESPWSMQGIGNGQMVEWTLERTSMPIFDAQFRRASSMTLTFPSGNEPPWTVGLNGSTAISNAFGRCVTDLTRRSPTQSTPPGPTQPFGQAQPDATEPAPQAPAQPAPGRSP